MYAHKIYTSEHICFRLVTVFGIVYYIIYLPYYLKWPLIKILQCYVDDRVSQFIEETSPELGFGVIEFLASL